MYISKKQLINIIQEYVYLPNSDAEAIMNIRKTLSTKEKKKADDLAPGSESVEASGDKKYCLIREKK